MNDHMVVNRSHLRNLKWEEFKKKEHGVSLLLVTTCIFQHAYAFMCCLASK